MELFQAASVFVMPSLYEGFGLPAAEAMACGIPTIASDRSSLPEVVGKAGILVRIEDGAQLALAMKSLVREVELARELAARGVERARRFTWRKAASLMEEVFRLARG